MGLLPDHTTVVTMVLGGLLKQSVLCETPMNVTDLIVAVIYDQEGQLLSFPSAGTRPPLAPLDFQVREAGLS